MSVATVGVMAVASPMIATGVVAMVGAVVTLRAVPALLVVAILIGAAGIVVPGYVVLRVVKVARAVGEPTVLARQAQDLATQARTGTDLARMAHRARRGAPRRRSGGKVRGAFDLGRLVARVLDAAQPDPRRHDRLAPLTPTQLRRVWLATLASLWVWAAAAIVVGLEVLAALALAAT